MNMQNLFLLLLGSFLLQDVVAVRQLRAGRAKAALVAQAKVKKGTAQGRFAKVAARRADAEAAEWAAAPPSERQYWMGKWVSVEKELLSFEKALGGKGEKVCGTHISALQLTGERNRNATKNATVVAKKENATVVAKKENATVVAKKENATDAAPAMSPMEEKIQAALAAATKGAKGAGPLDARKKAALEPMLGLLKGIYSDAKSRIGEMNAREKKSKADFAKKEAKHKEKMAMMKKKHEEQMKAITNHTSAHQVHEMEESYKNQTQWEEHLFNYWERCRDRQHKQFHNMLKMTHATMERESDMIKTYTEALNTKGTVAPKALQKVANEMPGGEEPEVVFVQLESARKFVAEEIQQVRKYIRYFV